MGRILAFDYGTKRVGIAVTDPLQMIATPLETIPTNEVFPFLKKYLASEEVEAFVLGWPRDLLGRETDSSQPINQFHQSLRNRYPAIPVHKVDERFTTSLAMDAMISGGSKKKDRQKSAGKVDTVSATLILQSYLEQR
ncbi:MAG TPA: Holliday junction resolvase RuvX [Cytophagales bacterium]|nr:Holliday junction resolvase RuvX [Cytophagales bacterium]HAA19838.1 Holliday junction resolvase RuvX [Cytophagales bacterium]HAP63768.1 Holliday junction resolvase RuvX [Cytophagales bacterium]